METQSCSMLLAIRRLTELEKARDIVEAGKQLSALRSSWTPRIYRTKGRMSVSFGRNIVNITERTDISSFWSLQQKEPF